MPIPRAFFTRHSVEVAPDLLGCVLEHQTQDGLVAVQLTEVEEYAARVRVPVLLIQGDADEYGTTAQLDAIAARVPHTETLVVPNAGHSPHRDAPELVLDRVAAFVARL